MRISSGVAGPIRQVGIEAAFLPVDAYAVLQQGLPDVEIVDGYFPLERLRMHKSSTELDLLRKSSERVAQSMLAVIGMCRTRAQARLKLWRSCVGSRSIRGLTFEYCLITSGTSLNRAVSDQRLAEGRYLVTQLGGSYRGYIGDLCRMGILGEPDPELEDLLGFVQEVQQCARQIIKPGATGRDVFGSPAATDRCVSTWHLYGLLGPRDGAGQPQGPSPEHFRALYGLRSGP